MGRTRRDTGVCENTRLANAWELKRVWPRAELIVVDDAGHGANPGVTSELVRATDRFALTR
jgi:proline iminopeptidase